MQSTDYNVSCTGLCDTVVPEISTDPKRAFLGYDSFRLTELIIK